MSTRNKNLLILAAMIAPFVLTFAYVRLFVNFDDMGRTNKGTLIIPHVDFTDLKPRHLDGSAFDVEELAGQWTMLYIASGDCDTACKNGLFYLITQLRKSLDVDTPRVRRLIAHTRDAEMELNSFLEEKVTGMDQLRVDSIAVEHASLPFMPGATSASNPIYLVRPAGKIFSWYPTQHTLDDVVPESGQTG